MNGQNNNLEFDALLEHLRDARGFEFTAYKRTTLLRRIRRRMAAVGAETYEQYFDYVQVHPDEFEPLFNTILINVTGFFRDPDTWDYLASELLPRTVQLKTPEGDDKPIRVWSAGCSSGEEAYTIAILLAEALGLQAFQSRVKIYGTDIDEDALNTARHGVYSAKDLEDLPEEYRRRYFEPVGDLFSFKKEYRRSVIFGRHNLIQDAPISRIDLLISRNTLMYLNADAQARVIDRFRYALNDGGYLLLGRSENLLSRSNAFQVVDLKHRVFVKPALVGARAPVPDLGLEQPGGQEGIDDEDLRRLQYLAFQADPIPQVILDHMLNVVFANNAAFALFDLTRRDLGQPFANLDLSYRPVELRSPVGEVLELGTDILLAAVPFPSALEPKQWIDIQISPLKESGGQQIGVRILFMDVTRSHELTNELQQLQADLETANEELQSSNEELETTNEELQSTVEELETTNEELQSTNEELETMNEELHSTNEALEAANDQLRERSDELNQAFAFLESVLTSMKSAVAVVEPGLTVRAWSKRAEELWGVRQDEAQGRHISNLDIGLPVDSLLQHIRACLQGRLEVHEEVMPAVNRRGRPISCHVSINPLKNTDGAITGVVILMEEGVAESEPGQ